MKELERCSICGEPHTEEQMTEFDGKPVCQICLARETVQCSQCGNRIWSVDNQGTISMPLCANCYENYYISCVECGRIIRREYACYEDGNDEPLCQC